MNLFKGQINSSILNSSNVNEISCSFFFLLEMEFIMPGIQARIFFFIPLAVILFDTYGNFLHTNFKFSQTSFINTRAKYCKHIKMGK